jgi:glycine/D-amino acid oxidase-like deaminating enzyme
MPHYAMDLSSGYPFWALRNGLMASFPPLQADARCEVAVIGAGISGALIADELARHDHDVLLLDERDIGWGSTAASTALLQYEIDTHLADLARQYGLDDALLAYRACAAAVESLLDLRRRFRDVELSRIDSLYYASRARDVRALTEEFTLRSRHGFDVEWLDGSAVPQRYGFAAPAAILTRPAGGVDPYRLTSRLLLGLRKRGVRICDRTAVESITPRTRDVLLTTRQGHQVRAAQVIVAAGYSSQQWLRQRVARNRSSYAFITDPLSAAQLGPLRHTLLWETARPYLYLRATTEGRLIVGGEDDAIDIPSRRDHRLPGKTAKLLRKTALLFPQLPLQAAYAWAGTFAETGDGLPWFGPHAQYGPRVHFAMAYGGNGITYSLLGAGLLRALIERRSHPLRALFSFARLDRA